MATLDYVSQTPRTRAIINAGTHLLVWSILFFLAGGLIAAYGIVSLLLMIRDSRGTEMLVLLALALVIFGSITLLMVLLGLRCRSACKSMAAGNRFDFRRAVRLFDALIVLGGAGALASLIAAADRSGFGLTFSLIYGGCSVIPTSAALWTRSSLLRAQKELMHTPPDPSLPSTNSSTKAPPSA